MLMAIYISRRCPRFGSFRLFLPFRNIHAHRSKKLVWRWIDDLSRMSYGMHLAHIILPTAVHSIVAKLVDNAFLRMTNIAFTTFVSTFLAVKLFSLLPGSRYVVE
jgi:peptidoglycan/LPS O-acetylase OafA/YrhL